MKVHLELQGILLVHDWTERTLMTSLIVLMHLKKFVIIIR
jgi:hypothetical protein